MSTKIVGLKKKKKPISSLISFPAIPLSNTRSKSPKKENQSKIFEDKES